LTYNAKLESIKLVRVKELFLEVVKFLPEWLGEAILE
tara:strand:+ start:189 stop:299 length:111 start_codon:yes stop_codon:yes gene_type:complete